LVSGFFFSGFFAAFFAGLFAALTFTFFARFRPPLADFGATAFPRFLTAPVFLAFPTFLPHELRNVSGSVRVHET
jgi:hypothetical protein